MTTMKTVVALFDNIPDARYAVDALLLRKYDPSDIQILAEDLAQLHDAPVPVAQVAAGAIGTLASAGALSIPYFGPLVAAAPLLTTIAATGPEMGDDDRWLVHALAHLGVPPGDAVLFADGVEEGGALVLVRARDVVAADIAGLLSDCGAVDIEARRRATARPAAPPDRAAESPQSTRAEGSAPPERR
ncbi:MAG TPA: hypothetical protein VIK91_03150 [Nannocystis sp.]